MLYCQIIELSEEIICYLLCLNPEGRKQIRDFFFSLLKGDRTLCKNVDHIYIKSFVSGTPTKIPVLWDIDQGR